MPDKLKKLQTIMKELNEGLTREEFTIAFKTVLKVVKDIKDTNSQEWKLIHDAMKKIPDKMMFEMREDISKTEKKMVRDCIAMCEKMCADMEKRHKTEMGKLSLDVAMIQADREAIIEDALARVPSPEEETPEQVIEKINSSEAKIDKARIAGLEDEIKALRKEIATKASAGARRVYQPYVDDFTALTNGSTKIFYLSREPLKTGSVMVYGTDFPTILRPTIDFTIVGKKLTLTSTVPAPNTGATLICTFFA